MSTNGIREVLVYGRGFRRLLNDFESLEDPDDLENAQDLDDPQHPRLALQPCLIYLILLPPLRQAMLRGVEIK
jgi:hypothetical protein